jgi:hypothetical protein
MVKDIILFQCISETFTHYILFTVLFTENPHDIESV